MAHTTGTSLILGTRTYDILKWIAQIFLPALGTLYYTLAGIWGLPNAEQIVGTIMAVDLFLGLLLGLSSHQYNKNDVWADGELTVETEDGVPYRMEANLKNVENPMQLANQDRVSFKVNTRDTGMQL